MPVANFSSINDWYWQNWCNLFVGKNSDFDDLHETFQSVCEGDRCEGDPHATHALSLKPKQAGHKHKGQLRGFVLPLSVPSQGHICYHTD